MCGKIRNFVLHEFLQENSRFSSLRAPSYACRALLRQPPAFPGGLGRFIYLPLGHSPDAKTRLGRGGTARSNPGRFRRPSPVVPAGGDPASRDTGTFAAPLVSAGSRGGGSGRRGGAALTSSRGRAPPFPQPLRLLASGPRRLPAPSRVVPGVPTQPSPQPARGAAAPAAPPPGSPPPALLLSPPSVPSH